MSNKGESDSTDSLTQDSSNTVPMDASIDDGTHGADVNTWLQSSSVDECNDDHITVPVPDIFLPNGQPMNAKTTMQCFDTPVSRNLVAAVANARVKQEAPKIQTNALFLSNGELINAKNTARSYNSDVENQGNMATNDNDNTAVTSESVVAEEVSMNPNTSRRRQTVNELNIEAYAVQSIVLAMSEPIRPWFTKRILYLILFIVVICSTIIGAGVYCGLGNCISSEPKVKPLISPTLSPIFASALPSTMASNTKESTITAYINSIILSNRTVSVNGSSAEDLALSWIIHEDPIFINIDDSIWSSLLLTSTSTFSVSSTHIRLRQRYALLSMWFQQPLQTDGRTAAVVPHWNNISGWLQDENECVWYGIKCNLINMGGFIGGQHVVTEIDFYNNNVPLSGGNNMAGTIPADFGLLTNLNRIDVSENNLYGTIPAFLFEQLTTLESINIGSNKIIGTIPESIGRLSNLKNMNIANNQITGTIPESIGHCLNLERFDIGKNQLTGTLPDSMGNFKHMKVFNVQYNQLNGTLPISFGNWTVLTDFYIYNNQFYGTIPDMMVDKWNVLKNFNIEYNRFTGTLPYTIGQLSNVKRLDVSDNMLTGTIPESIGNCTSLVFFSIEDNMIHGTIPESIGMLTSLTALFLFNNELTGTIPDVVGQFTLLRYMSLENNFLSGTIPLSVGNWSNIVSVHFYNNTLIGTVPNILCSYNVSNITADCVNELECNCCTHCY